MTELGTVAHECMFEFHKLRGPYYLGKLQHLLRPQCDIHVQRLQSRSACTPSARTSASLFFGIKFRRSQDGLGNLGTLLAQQLHILSVACIAHTTHSSSRHEAIPFF